MAQWWGRDEGYTMLSVLPPGHRCGEGLREVEEKPCVSRLGQEEGGSGKLMGEEGALNGTNKGRMFDRRRD